MNRLVSQFETVQWIKDSSLHEIHTKEGGNVGVEKIHLHDEFRNSWKCSEWYFNLSKRLIFSICETQLLSRRKNHFVMVIKSYDDSTELFPANHGSLGTDIERYAYGSLSWAFFWYYYGTDWNDFIFVSELRTLMKYCTPCCFHLLFHRRRDQRATDTSRASENRTEDP